MKGVYLIVYQQTVDAFANHFKQQLIRYTLFGLPFFLRQKSGEKDDLRLDFVRLVEAGISIVEFVCPSVLMC
eukprot:m.200017 g.200017  ORF g.200017 m.200017 type:complete len:72 (-) comp14952_c1_seq3:692-907(-)